MDTDRFRRIQELFDAALDRAPGERAAFLDDACAGDRALRARVERLLAQSDRRTPFAGVDPARATASVVSPAPSPSSPPGDAAGTRIGRYKVLQLIGEGGFGSVYLAEQEAPVRRQVALKVIKLGMDTKQVIARFEAERQALAMMDHANIARVLDAGATDTGRPYFVMDLVRGVPITEYCDLHALTTVERLELFVQVCGAVQHAHQKGIIHRDLKPSNVMVALQDGRPVPKVIDFGIAKATNQRLTEKTLFTEFHQFVGTPEYMSPEQAEMSGLDVDTRSDIYSLGVLLYELLTGTTPFDSAKLRAAAYAEVQRIILNEEPPKPSTRLHGLAATSSVRAADGAALSESLLAEIAKRRRTDPAALRSVIRGELDWIVMRSIDKDRRRRYDTAKDLADDVQRYLHDDPVLAGPPSALYAGRKFIVRHRAIATAFALVFVGLLGGLTVATAGFVRARQDRDRAVASQRFAQDARDESEAVTEFLAGLLTAVKPGEGGLDVTVREVLGAASLRIESRFRDQPLPEARLRDAIGETYRALGDFASAEPHLLVALEIREHVLGDENDRTLESVDRLGHLYWEQGRFPECESLFARSLAVRRRMFGDGDLRTADAMNSLGVLYRRLGRYEEAERLYRESLEVRRRGLGPDDPQTLSTMNNLALLLKSLGRYDEAEPLYQAALAGHRRSTGPEHPETLTTMNNLASLYARVGRYDEAEPLYLETLRVRSRVLGATHPRTLTSKNNLGYLYGLQGRVAEAVPLYVDVLAQRRAVLTDDHANTLDTMHNLATAYRQLARYEAAETLFDEAFERRRRVLGADHPETLTTMANMVVLYRELDRLEDARALARETVDLRRRRLGPEHPDTLHSIAVLANIYRVEDRCDEALAHYAEAIQGQRAERGSTQVDLGRTLAGCGACLVRVGRYLQAEETLTEAHRILATAPAPADVDDTREVARSLVRLYEAWERPRAADEWRARAEIEE